MCMTMYPAPASAATGRMSGSSRPAETSFTIDAPAARVARATVALGVSTLIGTSVAAASRSITGTTRRSSSSAGTGAAPGRVDSPPTSTTSAPVSTSSMPWATAASGSRKQPPSEKESGVTLRTPMTAARAPHTRSQSNTATPPSAEAYRRGLAAAHPRLPDEAHGLGAGGRIVLEHAPHGGRDGEGAGLLHAPHRHAQVLGLDDHEHVRREDVDEGVGDLGGQPLLHLGALGEPGDHARQLRQPGDAPVGVGDVRDVGAPVERNEVVLAVAGERDVAHHHHLVVIGLEGGRDVTARVLTQAAEDLLVHVGDAARRVLEPIAIRVLADRLEDLAHGTLDP